MRLRGFLLYCGTALMMIGVPVGACWLNHEYVDGRTNLVGMLGDLHVDKGSDPSRQRLGVLDYGVRFVESGRGIGESETPEGHGISASCSWTCLTSRDNGHDSFVFENPEFTEHHNGVLSGETYEGNRQPRQFPVDVFAPQLALGHWQLYFILCGTEDNRSDDALESARRFLDGKAGRDVGDRENVSLAVGQDPGCSDKLIGRQLFDLASDVGLPPRIHNTDLRVSSQNDPPVHLESNDGGSEGRISKEPHKYARQPRYMRREWMGTELGAKSDQGTYVDLRFEDIDVSNDSIHWFHFGGDVCLRDLPVYRSSVR